MSDVMRQMIEQSLKNHEAKTSSKKYDPREVFMNSPGERARQARLARCAPFARGSYGGCDANYTR